MSQEIKFCPNCNNILNITKNPPKKKQTSQFQQIAETPNTISEMSNNSSVDEEQDEHGDKQNEVVDESKKIEEILSKLEKGETVADAEYNDLRFEQFTKHKNYTKLDKKLKPEIQAKLIAHYEKLEDATSAYYMCNICYYSKPIEAGTLIMTKMSTGVTGTYMNYDKLKNRVYNKMLGYTRNYICYNDKCASHNDPSKREAVIYRVGSNVQAWYTCKTCQTYWKGE